MDNKLFEKFQEYLQIKKDEDQPLTKPKGLKKDKYNPNEDEEIEQEVEDIKETVLKPKKPRKPKTENQIKAFKEKCATQRQSNILKKQEDHLIESAKLLLKREMSKQQPTKEIKKSKKIQEPETDSETEEEIIHIKKPKKKPKKIIVVHSDNSSSSESEEPEFEPMKVKDFGKSHNHKKYKQPVKEEKPRIIEKKINFFTD
jgi:hypothetical protein